MRYKLDFSEKFDVSAPSVTGAMVGEWKPDRFFAWVPSTWPPAPTAVDEQFIENLKRIFEESILAEVRNVIEDVQKSRPDLQHRGHVIAIGLLCALDAIASYGYRGHHVADFIAAHFRDDYKPFAADIYELHRCNLVHSWNLFEAAIYPDRSNIKVENGVLGFGLLDFFDVLVAATEDFLDRLDSDGALQRNTLGRYTELQTSAKG